MIVTSEITGAPYYTHWSVATSRIPLGSGDSLKLTWVFILSYLIKRGYCVIDGMGKRSYVH